MIPNPSKNVQIKNTAAIIDVILFNPDSALF